MDKPNKPALDGESPAHRYTCETLEAVHEAQTKILESQQRIELVQARQAADIENHIRRTDTLQDIVERLDGKVSRVEALRNQVEGAAKLLLSVSALAAAFKLISLLF